jgi:hypothetical protein
MIKEINPFGTYSSAPISVIESPSLSPSISRASPSMSVVGDPGIRLVPASIHGELGFRWPFPVKRGSTSMLLIATSQEVSPVWETISE